MSDCKPVKESTTISHSSDESKWLTPRPNSSRFPPIASIQNQSHKSATLSRSKQITIKERSTSFDITYCEPRRRPHSSVSEHNQECIIDCKDEELISGSPVPRKSLPSLPHLEYNSDKPQNTQHNQLQNGFNSIDLKIVNLENEIETKCAELIRLKNEIRHLSLISPIDEYLDSTDDSYDEIQRLRGENENLRQNFVTASDIIKKCNKQLSRKDDIIRKLQRKQSTGDRLTANSVDINFVDILQECVLKPLIQLRESDSPCDRIAEIIGEIIRNMIVEFRPQLINLSKKIDSLKENACNSSNEMLDQYNRSDMSGDDEQVGEMIRQLKDKQVEVEESCEKLINENNSLKSSIKEFCDLCGIEKCDTIVTTFGKLKNTYEELVRQNENLKHDFESLKSFNKIEEENIFSIIEIISDIELELELSGRNAKTLESVIRKFSNEFQVNNPNGVSLHLPAMKKLLIQIYKNQLKSCEMKAYEFNSYVNRGRNHVSSRLEQQSSAAESELISNTDNNNRESMAKNESIINDMPIDSNLCAIRDMSGEVSFDQFLAEDIDIASINYILLAKALNQCAHNLDVVNEEEENSADVDVDEDEYETLSDDGESDNQINGANNMIIPIEAKYFSKINSEPVIKINDFEEDIEPVVALVLDELISNVDNNIIIDENRKRHDLQSFREEIIKNKNTNPVQSMVEVRETPFVKVDVSVQNNFAHEKDKLDDSAFASDDNCSSPDPIVSDDFGKHSKILINVDDLLSSKVTKKLTANESITAMGEEDIILIHNKLRQLEAQRDSQDSELALAKSRISQLESLIITTPTSEADKHFSQSGQYFTDELNAWKELVEHQKAIMQKILGELEETHAMMREKDNEINALKTPNSPKYEAQTQTETDDHKSTDNGVANVLLNYTDDESDYDVFGLNELFFDQSISPFPTMENLESDLIDRDSRNCKNEEVNNDVDGEKLMPRQAWKEEAESNSRQSHVSSINSQQINDEFYESEYSTDSDSRVPKSIPEEILFNRFKSSNDDESKRRVRRHSCQGRVVYGDHPRKRRLQLKNIEIVFNPNDNSKNKIQR